MSTSDSPGEITKPLGAINRGEPQSTEQLLPLVYDELRRLARHRLRHELPGQNLEATAPVHGAYLRLVGDDPGKPWNGRRHFRDLACDSQAVVELRSGLAL
jgi:hypothetical protein